jgi:hypothetical protein
MKTTIKIIAMLTVFISVVVLAFVSLIVIAIACVTTATEKDLLAELPQGDIWVNESGELIIINKEKAIA